MPGRALKAGAPTVIWDADMSTDVDDAGALAVLHALADLGECDIIALMVSSINGATPLAMDAINHYYGRAGIPIGVRPDIGGPFGGGNYPAAVAEDFDHPTYEDPADCPLAVTLYRQLLADADDASITIISTGYLTNLEALLASTADGISALSGADLVAQKVVEWVCMGGAYPSGSEFNFDSSGDDSAEQVVNNWPTAATFIGYEVGTAIEVGDTVVDTLPTSSPIRRAFEAFTGDLPRAAWDQCAIYMAVRASEGVFDTVTTGSNTVDTDGSNAWVSSPDPSGPLEQQYVLTKPSTLDVAREVIDLLTLAPAAATSPAVAPTQPTNLRVTSVTASSVSLAWTVNSYSETAVVVERRDSGTWTVAATLAPGTATWPDPNPLTTDSRHYRVKVANGSGASPAIAVTSYFFAGLPGRVRVNAGGGSGAPVSRTLNRGGTAAPVVASGRGN